MERERKGNPEKKRKGEGKVKLDRVINGVKSSESGEEEKEELEGEE